MCVRAPTPRGGARGPLLHGSRSRPACKKLTSKRIRNPAPVPFVVRSCLGHEVGVANDTDFKDAGSMSLLRFFSRPRAVADATTSNSNSPSPEAQPAKSPRHATLEITGAPVNMAPTSPPCSSSVPCWRTAEFSPAAHARKLLCWLRQEGLTGEFYYSEMLGFYRSMCQQENWAVRAWSPIGHALTQATSGRKTYRWCRLQDGTLHRLRSIASTLHHPRPTIARQRPRHETRLSTPIRSLSIAKKIGRPEAAEKIRLRWLES